MKYLGSKAKIADEIVAILHRYINSFSVKTYVEPFVGGFNVIDKVVCENRIGNDIDPLVCDLVETCRDDPALLDTLQTPTRAEYYDVRDNPQKYSRWYRTAILLFASYNARIYGGCYGATAKTKDGTVRNYFAEAKANFARQIPSLRGILVGCADYRDLRFPERERVLIYCDPPYSTGRGYGVAFDTVEFWSWARRQAAAGHIVIVSEYTAPDDWRCIWERTRISSLDNRQKVTRTEKLFVWTGADYERGKTNAAGSYGG